MPEVRFHVRHHHSGQRQDHWWVLRVQTEHPEATKILVHAFTRYVTVARDGVFIVEDELQTLKEVIQPVVCRFLEIDIPIELEEVGG